MLSDKTAGNLILKSFMYLSFPLGLMLVLLSILVVSNEVLSVDSAIDKQLNSNDPCLVGFAYSYRDPCYKKALVSRSNADVLALGTSRVMQFRQLFFKETTTFANAGGAVTCLHQFVPFLKSLGLQAKPKLLIISLDQYFFNDAWIGKNKVGDSAYLDSLTSEPDSIDIFTGSYRTLFQDLVRKKIDIGRVLSFDREKRVGMTAVMKTDGFRDDGSYRYGSRNDARYEWYDHDFKESRRRIERGADRFEYAEEVSGVAMEQLRELLSYCKNNGIEVIGFLPPFAPTVLNQLRRNGPRYAYMWKIAEGVNPLFREFSFDFFDFTEMSTYKSTDNEFIDGFHGSEITYARLMVEMCRKNMSLQKRADLVRLDQLLSHPARDTLLVEEHF